MVGVEVRAKLLRQYFEMRQGYTNPEKQKKMTAGVGVAAKKIRQYFEMRQGKTIPKMQKKGGRSRGSGKMSLELVHRDIFDRFST